VKVGPVPNFGFLHLQNIHLQKLPGPSVWRTTAGCAPAVALGVAQQAELPQGHAQTAYRHPSPSGPWNAVKTWFFFWREFFLSHGQRKEGRRGGGVILTGSLQEQGKEQEHTGTATVPVCSRKTFPNKGKPISSKFLAF